jgi:prophage regulatory protein
MAGRVLLRKRDVLVRTGLSESQLYLQINNHAFPRPVSIGARAVAWVESEIAEWIESRIAERDQGSSGASPKAA